LLFLWDWGEAGRNSMYSGIGPMSAGEVPEEQEPPDVLPALHMLLESDMLEPPDDMEDMEGMEETEEL